MRLRIAVLAVPAAMALAPPDAPAQASDLTQPPGTRLYFDVPARAPLVGQLFAQAGCELGSAETVRIELPGRRFDPPLAVDVDAADARARAPERAGPSDPLAALAEQVAAMRAAEVERAVAGWAPDARPTAQALLSDPAALEQYRAQAERAAAGEPAIGAIVWFETDEGPAAALLAFDGLSPWALGMPVGYRRTDNDGFLLTLAVALDPRFALVGRAVQAGQFGPAEDAKDGGPPPPGTMRYREVCRGGE